MYILKKGKSSLLDVKNTTISKQLISDVSPQFFIRG